MVGVLGSELVAGSLCTWKKRLELHPAGSGVCLACMEAIHHGYFTARYQIFTVNNSLPPNVRVNQDCMVFVKIFSNRLNR